MEIMAQADAINQLANEYEEVQGEVWEGTQQEVPTLEPDLRICHHRQHTQRNYNFSRRPFAADPMSTRSAETPTNTPQMLPRVCAGAGTRRPGRDVNAPATTNLDEMR